MIFIDSNISMYLVGGSHPRKDDARRLLERFVAERTALVTDAEISQEILHRYVAIDRRDAIRPSFAALLDVVDVVYPIDFPTPNAPATLCLLNESSPHVMPFISP
jgi:uncharacterized protein